MEEDILEIDTTGVFMCSHGSSIRSGGVVQRWGRVKLLIARSLPSSNGCQPSQ
jgi:hypothetical protein